VALTPGARVNDDGFIEPPIPCGRKTTLRLTVPEKPLTEKIVNGIEHGLFGVSVQLHGLGAIEKSGVKNSNIVGAAQS
jgi:hypothetical protein